MYAYIFISGFIILSASFSGKIVMYGAFGNFLRKNMQLLVTFTLGVFITTLYLMFSEARELNAKTTEIALIAGIGAIILEILQKIIPDAHHHHGTNKENCCDHKNNHKINPIRVLIGDAFHNIGDGIALVPAFLISTNTGIALTVGVFLHEFVQETSEFFLLKEAGYSTGRALWSNFTVQSTIFIGIIIGMIANSVTDVSSWLIALSIGMLLYIIIRDLLPHIIENVKRHGGFWKHILTGLLGFITLLTLSMVLPG